MQLEKQAVLDRRDGNEAEILREVYETFPSLKKRKAEGVVLEAVPCASGADERVLHMVAQLVGGLAKAKKVACLKPKSPVGQSFYKGFTKVFDRITAIVPNDGDKQPKALCAQKKV